MPSWFDEIAELAERHAAVDLAAGTADFDPPTALLEAASESLRCGPHQYSPSAGLPVLRSAIASHIKAHYGLEYDPESEVTVCAGATGGIWAVLCGLLGAGDEVLVVQPCFGLYGSCAIAAGANVRFVGGGDREERLPLDELEEAFGPQTRIVIVCTPSNPSGICLNSAEISALGQLAKRHDAVILSDETYEQIVLGDAEHTPVASDRYCYDRTITVSSISKTFTASGWRIGWVLAPPRLTRAVRAAHRLAVHAAPSPLQWATARMLETAAGDGYFALLHDDMTRRCRMLEMSLIEAGLKPRHPSGAFYLLAPVPGDGAAVCRRLVCEAGVAAIPGSAFFHFSDSGKEMVRFAFCKREQTLQEAGARLVAYARRKGGAPWD